MLRPLAGDGRREPARTIGLLKIPEKTSVAAAGDLSIETSSATDPMSHFKRYRRPRSTRSGMGDVGTVISTTVDVASDPYLPEVVCIINQLKATEAGQVPGACQVTPDNLPGGVGLRGLMMPLRAYSYAQQNKWVYPVAILAILGLPMLIGYELGKDD